MTEKSSVYGRALELLHAQKWLAGRLVSASGVIAIVQIAEPVLFGQVVDALVNGDVAWWIIIAWAGLGLLGIVAGITVAVYADRLAHRARGDAMTRAFDQAMSLPLSFHATAGSGAVIGTIQRGTDALFWLWLGALREQASATFTILLLLPVAIAMNLQMTGVLVILAVVYTILNIYVVGKTERGQQDVERIRYGVSGRIGDVISNVSVVQSYARLSSESAAMREMTSDLLSAQYPVLTWWGLLAVLQRAAATIAMVVILTLGSVLAARGVLSVGEIVSFVAFSHLLIGKMDQLSAYAVQTQQAAPSLSQYFSLIDSPGAVEDKPGARVLSKVRGHVRFENVCLQFGNGSQGVFDLSFEAHPGDTVALVGPTGAGKTTAVSLLQRLQSPQSGRILVDGFDIRDVALRSLRGAMSVVFQDAMLFNRSIRENILLGRSGASETEVIEAAQVAQADGFIANKPGGYDFVIGEGGAALSGGERQRLSIARAVLKDAPILILDEATSALDVGTERRIKAAVDGLRAGRTTFVIAHRLSTVSDADLILVMDEGRIVERGAYEELVAGGGLFAQMVSSGGFLKPERLGD